jgi:hypothetical protein
VFGQPNDTEIASFTFSADGRLLVSESDSGVFLWDVASGNEVRSLSGLKDFTGPVVFSPSSHLLAAPVGASIKLWDVDRDYEVRTFNGKSQTVHSIAFSPDGSVIAATFDDSSVSRWDVTSGRELGRFVEAGGSSATIAFSPDGKSLALGVADGTTRLLDATTGSERASLVAFTDGSSIAVTPEGFFDSSSPSAEENLNVRIGDRVFGISSFRENFYRPDLVRRSLAGEDISSFGDIANVKLSPQIELGELPATTTDPKLHLSVKLTDGGGGLGPVRLFEEGTVVLQDDAVGAASRSYTLPLTSGANDVRVEVANTSGDMWSEAQGQVSLAAPANNNAATPPKGVLHAVVIGIDAFPKFPKEDQIDLTYAAADAQLFSDTLQKSAAPLFASMDVKLLTKPEETDRASIETALKAMQASVGPNDAFVFFVASHGIVRGGEYYVVTSNTSGADPASLAHDALSRRELTDLLANIATTHKVVFIDTCQAGKLGDADQPLFATRGMDDKTAAKIISEQIGLTMLMASGASEEATEGYQNHGLFTWVLTQGLAGNAADPATSLVTSQSLASYVDTQVPPLAQSLYHQDQTPIDNQAGQAFPIARAK